MIFWFFVWLSLPIVGIWFLKEIGWVMILTFWIVDILKQKGEIEPELGKLIRTAKDKSDKLKELLATSSGIKSILVRLEIDSKRARKCGL